MNAAAALVEDADFYVVSTPPAENLECLAEEIATGEAVVVSVGTLREVRKVVVVVAHVRLEPIHHWHDTVSAMEDLASVAHGLVPFEDAAGLAQALDRSNLFAAAVVAVFLETWQKGYSGEESLARVVVPVEAIPVQGLGTRFDREAMPPVPWQRVEVGLVAEVGGFGILGQVYCPSYTNSWEVDL